MPALVAPEALDAVLNACLDSQFLDTRQKYAADYLRKKVLSKYSDGNISKHAENLALDKFVDTCYRVSKFKFTAYRLHDELYLGNFKYRVWKFFHGLDEQCSPISLHQRGGVGPGASIAAHGTDFLKKFYYGPLSATSLDVFHSYIRGCATNPLDLSAAKIAANKFGVVVKNCSRISFVEKNVDEARTIATEPSVNMFFQLAIGSVIDDRSRVLYGFSKSRTPDVNRELARIGSIDGSYSTIDLSSASDSISLDLCRNVLPDFMLDLIHRYRCEFSELPDGRIIRLPMVSTMGNGWTFSLMTALIYCALHAACDTFGDSKLIRQCSVFGDDIVCPTQVSRHVYHILELLGFVVNVGKSYTIGDFRESCGHDFYRGRFVRPVFVRKLSTQDSLYVAFNRFAEWGAFHDVNLFPVLKLLRKASRSRLYVPREDDYASGFRVPSICYPKSANRYGLWRYKRLESVPTSYKVVEGPQGHSNVSPSVNPDGVFVAMLGGYLRDGKISMRSKRTVRWRLASRVTPRWDFRRTDPCPGWDQEAERRWELALFTHFN